MRHKTHHTGDKISRISIKPLVITPKKPKDPPPPESGLVPFGPPALRSTSLTHSNSFARTHARTTRTRNETETDLPIGFSWRLIPPISDTLCQLVTIEGPTERNWRILRMNALPAPWPLWIKPRPLQIRTCPLRIRHRFSKLQATKTFIFHWKMKVSKTPGFTNIGFPVENESF